MSDTRKSEEQGHAAEAGATRPEGESKAAPASGVGDGKPQRFAAKRKQQSVQRLMGGESLEALSRELGVTLAQLSEGAARHGHRTPSQIRADQTALPVADSKLAMATYTTRCPTTVPQYSSYTGASTR